ncbi:MAG: hypothetical protein JXP34_23635, partial [Planctomycetes bacterium]|nr:hypothetical protein [Planctomycetota bacterium]
IQALLHLFASTQVPCPKAADTDDSGILELGDIVYLLDHLFCAGPAPDPPYPLPGEDPVSDDLPCGIPR